MTVENQDLTKPLPARIYVLYSKQSNSAIILRKGPSKWLLTIGWNLLDDDFQKGQWLKGKIYSDKCDISPDGKHWVYFAYKQTPYTVVARAPYLKALHLYPDSTTWYGGGYFDSHEKVSILTDPKEFKEVNAKTLKVGHFSQSLISKTSILEAHLKRKNWRTVSLQLWNEGSVFELIINPQWRLRLITNSGKREDGGNQLFFYQLVYKKEIANIDTARWEWADYDAFNERVIWAEMGLIMTAKLHVSENEMPALRDIKCLLDTNDMQFEELIAPY